MNNCPQKSENLKPQGSLHALLVFFSFFSFFFFACLFVVFFLKQPPNIIPDRNNILQNSVENTHAGFFLVPGHRPSYLQKMNYAACCPWNFEVNISRNILD